MLDISLGREVGFEVTESESVGVVDGEMFAEFVGACDNATDGANEGAVVGMVDSLD